VTQDHCGSRGLVRPCTGVPDYFAPLFRFVDEESSKFGRGASKRSAAQNGKPILHLRIGKAEVYLCVELVDDFSRRILRRTDAEPYARVVTGQEFGHTLNIGQKLPACRSGHRESAHVPALMYSIDAVMLPNTTSTWPPMRSVSAGASPR